MIVYSITFGEKYSRMDQVKFAEDSRPYHVKFFKGCLPQILLGPFLNTLPRLILIKCPRVSCGHRTFFEMQLFSNTHFQCLNALVDFI